MAGSKSNYLEDAVLRLIFHGTAITLPASVYLALSTEPYSDTGLTAEVASGTGYARQAVARTTAQWTAPTGTPTALRNINPVNYPTATGTWGTVRSFYIMDASTGGNALYGADLAVGKLIQVGDAATFYANTLSIAED